MSILYKYATFLKYSEREDTCQYLIKTFGIETATWIIPFYGINGIASRLKSENFIPVSNINEDTLNSIDLPRFKQIYDVIKTLFGVKTEVSSTNYDVSRLMIRSVKPDKDSC